MLLNKQNLENFVSQFDDFSSWKNQQQVDYFAYFLTSILQPDNFTAKQIQNCFDLLSLKQYNRTPQYLSESASKKNGGYIKQKTGGYRLERSAYETIKQKINNEPKKVQVSQDLISLLSKINDPQEKMFLQEALNCYQVKAYRATIILTWILSIDHLQRYIFSKELTKFNHALTKNQDKRVKKISKIDDFSDLSESKFIALARSANAISNDVRKILDEKLGIRNSAAHPSKITFTEHKTTEFVLDMINNVLLKYQ